MSENNNKKSWRRLTIGAIWFLSFMGGFFYLATHGHSIEIIQLYVFVLTLGCLIFGGYITVTDALDRWTLKK